MTRPSRAAFRGEVVAAAYLLDRATIGDDEARARVLARWTPGTRLLAWPDGRWLLVLGTSETGRAEHAPGLPLVGGDQGLTTPGDSVTPGAVRLPRDDGGVTVAFADLAAVDVATWLATDAFETVPLTPMERDPDVDVPEPLPPGDGPDLRTLAGIAPTSAAADEFAASGTRVSRVRTVRVTVAGAIVLVAVVVGIVVLATRAGGPPAAVSTPVPSPSSAPTSSAAEVPVGTGIPTVDGTDFGQLGLPDPASGSDADVSAWIRFTPIVALLFFAGLIRALRRRKARPASAAAASGGAAASRPPPTRWRDAVTRWVLGSPAGGVIGRRHARYLRELGANLEHGRWDALAGAIALGGTGGVLSLRLPHARQSLSPAQASGTGTVMAYGPSVADHLRELYRRVAERLEGEGDTGKAAFVLAVLLRDPGAAVALLERAGDTALAAQVAEVRDLDPSLAVRLWWQAGNRERAVAVARARGAFAAAVVRLERVEPSLAHDLRAEWVRHAREAGDAVTAVDAAWPDPELRRLALPDLQAGLEAGGPAAGHLLARFLSGDWDFRPLDRVAVDLLSAPTPIEAALRTGFLTALAQRPVADATLDRRLCSAAALVTVRDDRALVGVPARTATTAVNALRRRADPLLAADLPAWQPAPVAAEATAVELTGPPGTLPVRDAVVLPDGSALVALGELGLRWATAAGDVRAQWSVPVDRVVVADHGRTALLVRAAGTHSELHRLDLPSRRVRYWATLRVRAIAESFDGTGLVTVDDDGVAVLDTLSDRPRVTWRELSSEQPVFALSRTPGRLSAVTLAPLPPGATRAAPGAAPRLFELFDWELPGVTLRLRRRFAPMEQVHEMLVLPGQAVQRGSGSLGAGISPVREWAPQRFEPVPPDHRVVTTADTLAKVGPGERGGFVATVRVGDQPSTTVRGSGPVTEVGIHRHGQVLTVHDGAGGRWVGIDVARDEIVARGRSAV